MVIALIVTPQGFPLAYEVMPGNTSDKTTLADFLEKIEAQYGRSDRIWIMDRGIPTEETLASMRASDPPVHYLVGTPKGRLTRLEKAFVGLPWRAVRASVEVKLLAEDGELYILAQSQPRILKERGMRRRRLKRLWRRLHELRGQSLQREDRIEAHIFVAFVAYCLHVTLKNLARPRAPGLTPRAILEKFSSLQMVDVHLPTTDGRHLILPRHTDPTRDQQLLLHQLKLQSPEQPPPRLLA